MRESVQHSDILVYYSITIYTLITSAILTSKVRYYMIFWLAYVNGWSLGWTEIYKVWVELSINRCILWRYDTFYENILLSQSLWSIFVLDPFYQYRNYCFSKLPWYGFRFMDSWCGENREVQVRAQNSLILQISGLGALLVCISAACAIFKARYFKFCRYSSVKPN